MKNLLFSLVLMLFAAFIFTASVNAQAQRINFKRGASSATISGSIAGSDGKTYVVSARNGQLMTMILKSRNNIVRFLDGESADEFRMSYRSVNGDNFFIVQNNGLKLENYTLIVSIK